MLVSACGVKGDPTSPKSPATASLMQNYPDIETDKPVDDVKRMIKPKTSKK